MIFCLAIKPSWSPVLDASTYLVAHVSSVFVAKFQSLPNGTDPSLLSQKKKNPVFTTALIAGDCVILDAIAKAGLLDKIQVIFIDTYFLFPETIDFLHEVRHGKGPAEQGGETEASRKKLVGGLDTNGPLHRSPL